jgi:ABC-2 type transport system ATP-binding protein
MRVREYLKFRAALRSIPRSRRDIAIDKVLADCWLSTPEDMSNRRMETLSRGYRQRVGLADCLLHDPPVLVLDEPTIGLDPAQVREMRNLVLNLGQSHTVILSSHILAEVEQVCKQIVIISSGRIVAKGTPRELRERVSGPGRLIVELRGAPAEEMAKELGAIPGVQNVLAADSGDWCRLAVQSSESTDVRPQVAAMAAAKGYQLRELRREVASLEDFFVQITYEQSMRQARPALRQA